MLEAVLPLRRVGETITIDSYCLCFFKERLSWIRVVWKWVVTLFHLHALAGDSSHLAWTSILQPGCQWKNVCCSQRLLSLCSYLGLGLMSARLAILGGVEGKPCKLWVLLKSWLWARGPCCVGRSCLSPSHGAQSSWVVCGLLSPCLDALETNAGGDTARSQETWILASFWGGMVHLSHDWGLEVPCWGCGTVWNRAGDLKLTPYVLP